jgi:hypothetical protein
MDRLFHSLLVALALGAGPASVAPVEAAPCAGFIDVDDSVPGQAPFCGNVAWMKNRQVTLGCSLPNSYCPNQDVIRLSMAAFLNRLGNALTPKNLTANNSGSTLNLDTPNQLCAVSSLLAPSEADFVRTAHGVAVITAGCSSACPTVAPDTNATGGAGADVGDLDYTIGIVESVDNGANWSPVSPLTAVSVGPSQIKTATVLLPPRDVSPAGPRQWGIRLARLGGSAVTLDINSWACQMQVRLENRVTTSAPFDAAEE